MNTNNTPLRMKSKHESLYTLRETVTPETIARVMGMIDDSFAFELLSAIHPVDRARVYRAIGA